MSRGKSPHSYRKGITVLDKNVELAATTEIKTCVDKKPTLADCIKYSIDTKYADTVTPELLTKEDYILLRQNGVSVKEIRIAYGFKDHNHYYKIISKFNVSPQMINAGIEEKEEFADLGEETDVVDSAPPEIFNQADSDRVLAKIEPPALPIIEPEHINQPIPLQKLTVITKYVCPMCYSEHGILIDAENCLNSHAYIINIDNVDGYSFDDNCPNLLSANLSDGRTATYMQGDTDAYCHEDCRGEDGYMGECSQYNEAKE